MVTLPNSPPGNGPPPPALSFTTTLAELVTAHRLRALTFYQPWATLMADGHKLYETRSWRPPPHRLRQLIAIHAAKTCDNSYRRTLRVSNAIGFDPVPLRAIVAVAFLEATYPTPPEGGFPPPLADAPKPPYEHYFGDYSPGRWVWQFSQVHKLAQPVPCLGNRNLWLVPTDLAETLVGQWLQATIAA